MNIANWLYQTSLNWPDRPAVYQGARLVHTYGSLLKAVLARAADMRGRLGLRKGDRIALLAHNSPEYLEIMHAAWWLGAAVVPINFKLHPAEALWIVRDADVAAVFTDTGDVFAAQERLDEQPVAFEHTDVPKAPPERLERSDLAWLFYTSGTTGKPKGVVLSHDNLLQMSLCYALDVDQPQASDVMVYAAPMSHGAGLYTFVQMRAGGAHCIPASQGFDPKEIMELTKALGNLVFFAAPTMVKRLVTASIPAGYRGEGIRTIIYGGGPMYQADIDEAVECYGNRFVQIYGQGETPMTISVLPRDLVSDTTHPNWRSRRASVGVVQGSVELEIRGRDGQRLAEGETGEICVRGPTVMSGYWRNPYETASTVKDGWLHTGDLGHLDAEGFLYLTDRSKDVIISGGTNIYPREVEETLLQHPDVYECAVVGERDADWGENVVAFVTPKEGREISKEELDLWCRSHIASFKKPKRYVFSDSLPKNEYGKILKTELRERLSSSRVARESARPSLKAAEIVESEDSRARPPTASG